MKHGLLANKIRHPLYRVWSNIKQRCYNASKHNFPFYQGKGIKMCDEWFNNAALFYNWAINNGWEKGLSIDRIDSSKDYCPENCQFISLSENSKKAQLLSKKSGVKKNIKNIIGKKLNIEQVIEIKKDLFNKLPHDIIAERFGIDKSFVSKIKRNIRWRHIEIPVS